MPGVANLTIFGNMIRSRAKVALWKGYRPRLKCNFSRGNLGGNGAEGFEPPPDKGESRAAGKISVARSDTHCAEMPRKGLPADGRYSRHRAAKRQSRDAGPATGIRDRPHISLSRQRKSSALVERRDEWGGWRETELLQIPLCPEEKDDLH